MPKIVDHEQRRAELVDVILKVMGRYGLSGTTIRSIAREGGFSSGVLSHYFSSKEEMVNFAFGAVADAIFARAEKRLELAESPRQRVRILIEELVPRKGNDPESVVSVAFWGMALHDPALRKQFHDRYESWRGYLRRELQAAAKKTSSKSPQSVEDTVDLVISITDGFAVSWTLDPKRYDAAKRERLIDRALDLLVQG
jgi:AcrR family transcriptional regulator